MRQIPRIRREPLGHRFRAIPQDRRKIAAGTSRLYEDYFTKTTSGGNNRDMPQGRGLYQGRVAVVHIPKELKTYVEAEGEKIGAFTLVETMRHILTQYFHLTANIPVVEATPGDSPLQTEPTKKEVKHGPQSDEPFVPYLRSR